MGPEGGRGDRHAEVLADTDRAVGGWPEDDRAGGQLRVEPVSVLPAQGPDDTAVPDRSAGLDPGEPVHQGSVPQQMGELAERQRASRLDARAGRGTLLGLDDPLPGCPAARAGAARPLPRPGSPRCRGRALRADRRAELPSMPWPGLPERPVWFVAWVWRTTAAARRVALPGWAGCDPGTGTPVEPLSWLWLVIGLCLLTVRVVAGRLLCAGVARASGRIGLRPDARAAQDWMPGSAGSLVSPAR